MEALYASLMTKFQNGSILSQVVDHSHALILVVDGQRRIVYGSRGMMDLAGVKQAQEMLGRTPGDFFHCINAKNADCGESPSCCECGALFGISLGLKGTSVDRECFLTLSNEERLQARDFHIRATPLDIDDSRYVVLSLQDIGHEKRRKAQEQVFLHDILNTVGAVKGILHFLRSDMTGENRELLDTVLPYFDLCVDEISAQQKLLAAENNELRLSQERFSLGQLLQGLANIHSQHALGKGRDIAVEMETSADEVISDRTIVHRMCMNLLKNALEATPEGETVRLVGEVHDDRFHCEVRNPGAIPDDVQRHLFRRTFSTKGPGRGLGVYSVHLLCTNYLHGRVWFETGDGGTAFHLLIPQGQDLQQA